MRSAIEIAIMAVPSGTTQLAMTESMNPMITKPAGSCCGRDETKAPMIVVDASWKAMPARQSTIP